MAQKPDAFFLSQEDRKWLQRLVEQEMKKIVNPRERTKKPSDVIAASGVYVVKVPEDGIPARSSEGVLGSALCEIVRRNRGNDNLATIPSIPSYNRKIKVWNHYLLPWPPGTTYVFAEKDLYGEFYCHLPDPVFGVFRGRLDEGSVAQFEVLSAADETPTGIMLEVGEFYFNQNKYLEADTKAEIVQFGEKLVWRNAYCGPSDTLVPAPPEA